MADWWCPSYICWVASTVFKYNICCSSECRQKVPVDKRLRLLHWNWPNVNHWDKLASCGYHAIDWTLPVDGRLMIIRSYQLIPSTNRRFKLSTAIRSTIAPGDLARIKPGTARYWILHNSATLNSARVVVVKCPCCLRDQVYRGEELPSGVHGLVASDAKCTHARIKLTWSSFSLLCFSSLALRHISSPNHLLTLQWSCSKSVVFSACLIKYEW